MTKNLLLLHGALGSRTQLETLKSHLASNYEVHSLNFEGHGGRLSEKDFSIHQFTENVRDYLTENKIQKTGIFGYSMGGYVALNLALHHPELVDSIVTLGTKVNWNPESAAKEVKMLNPEVIEEKVPAFAEQLQKIHGQDSWKELLRKTADMMLDLGNGKALQAEDYQKINQGVLVTVGSLDNMVTIDESEFLSKNLKNATLQVIDGFKHPIEKVDHQKLASIIDEFLSQ